MSQFLRNRFESVVVKMVNLNQTGSFRVNLSSERTIILDIFYAGAIYNFENKIFFNVLINYERKIMCRTKKKPWV